MPKVSVALTSFNHAKYLRESIESVLNQTYSDFELIIIDDCSSDDSWEIIEEYQDERIIKIRNPENQLFYANDIIENVARGKYIAVQHSDDVWEPNKLSEQVAFLDMHPECGATFTWVQAIDEDGKPFGIESHFYCDIFDQPNRTRHEWLKFFFYNGNALCHPSVLIRKKCYEDCGLYRDGLAQLPDLDMWIRLCMKYEIYIMPKRLLRFRIRNNEANMSGGRRDTRIRTATEYYQVWDSFLAIDSFFELALIFPSVSSYFRVGGCNVRYIFARICLEEGTFHWARAFGINLLFELMRDKKTREELIQLYDFSHHDFLQITRENEFFLLETVAEKEDTIAEKEMHIGQLNNNICQFKHLLAENNGCIGNLREVISHKDAEIAAMNEDYQKLQKVLSDIYNSKKWRLWMKMKAFVRFFIGK